MTNKTRLKYLLVFVTCMLCFTLGYFGRYIQVPKPTFVYPKKPYILLHSPEGQEIGNLYWVSRIILDTVTGREDTVELKGIDMMGVDTLHSEIK